MIIKTRDEIGELLQAARKALADTALIEVVVAPKYPVRFGQMVPTRNTTTAISIASAYNILANLHAEFAG